MSPAPSVALGLALATVFLPSAVLGQATISEFLADNRSGITDSDGESSDWIEIQNTGNLTLDLAGWHMTDTAAEPMRWTLPPVVVPPGGFLIVFASGKNRTDPADELHTNFGLSSSGEYLALISPDGAVVSEYDYPPQREDVAYGRSGNTQTEVVLTETADCRWRVPTSTIPGWVSGVFDDGGWSTGETGIGYDRGTDYNALIGTDIQPLMDGVNGSAYIRVPFTLTDASEILGLTLNLRYDDGFIAWLNGTRIASSNAPAAPAWNSLATDINLDADAIVKEPFDASAAIPDLVEGTNVLAIQMLNATLDSSDLLALPELIANRPDSAANNPTGYLLTPTPGGLNGNTVGGFVADTKFSTKRGFYTSPVLVTISSETEGATIRYTTNGATPTETSGTVYTNPVQISTTTILRAIAFKDGLQPTNVDTQTYLFPAAVKNHGDMDSAVVNNPVYAAGFESDLSGNLPVMSMVVDNANFFGGNGIYANPNDSGRGAEVPVSIEFFNPADSTDQFQIDAGVRIHGGNARSHPKKPMRLYFRGEYGDRRLRHPLFPGSPVESFDQLILRGGGHDSWSLAATFGRDADDDLPPHGLIMRDQFLRITETEMGLLSPRSRYSHLYINGRYWGIYDIHERANAAYFESHLGGSEDDYDVLHHPEFIGEDYVVVDGSGAAWEAARTIAGGALTSAAQYASLQEYIDMDNLIDHLIVRMWSGDYDWCGPISRPSGDVTVFSNKNWYTGRRSRGNPGKFHFFSWDAEMSMGNHLVGNIQFPAPSQRVLDFDLTGANDAGTPVEFYAALRSYPEFQQRFADRLQKHFFNDGAMSVAGNIARWDRMRDELFSPMVAEAARWGDEGTAGAPFTRNETWQQEVFWIRNSFLVQRNTIVLNQFRARGLYPNTAAPIFSQHGGSVPMGFELNMTSAGNLIYYTTDGSDPYLLPEVEFTTLVPELAEANAFVPTNANGGAALSAGTWNQVSLPPLAHLWLSGQTGVGYETSSTGIDYEPLINLDVVEAFGTNPGVFVRLPFEISPATDLAAFSTLTLSMKYDDGFVAYLNGQRIAEDNAPANPSWNSPATGNRSDAQAVVFQDFDISNFLDLLVNGQNMLAIHALNDGTNSSDLLCVPRLAASTIVSGGGPSPSATLFEGAVTLDETTQVRARAVAGGGRNWSPLTEATFLVGQLASAENLVVSEFSYRPLPPYTPAEIAVASSRTGFEFVELMNIGDIAIDLTGVNFSQGIEFNFVVGTAITMLQPGEFALLVSDATAFEARYGSEAAARVAGEFENDTKLSNDGESITLLAADGSTIKSFTYSDMAPWPNEADGEGYSLELISPSNNPNHALPESWRASAEIGGSPAGSVIRADYSAWAARYFSPINPAELSAPGDDADGDGWSNLAEYLFGTSPVDRGSVPEIEVSIAEVGGTGYLALSCTIRAGIDDVTITGQTSTNLANWTGDTVELPRTPPDADGMQTVTFRTAAPMDDVPRQLRLQINLNADPGQ